MGESPTLGKFGGKFWKEGGNDGRGKMEGRGEKRKGNREARKKGKMEREKKGKLWRKT